MKLVSGFQSGIYLDEVALREGNFIKSYLPRGHGESVGRNDRTNMKPMKIIGLIGMALMAIQPITAAPQQQHSPDGRFSVQMQTNPEGHDTDFTDKVILLRRGKTVIGEKIIGGGWGEIFWDKAGKYVSVGNHLGSAGGDTWVFRLNDGKCIGSVITDSDLVEKATEAMKRLDSRITDEKLVKRIVEAVGWTKEGVLEVEVYTRYEVRRSENEGESHGEEAQFTYHGNMNVEGSKLVLVDGKAEEGHRTW